MVSVYLIKPTRHHQVINLLHDGHISTIDQRTPRYSWKTAKIGVKHQSINQSIQVNPSEQLHYIPYENGRNRGRIDTIKTCMSAKSPGLVKILQKKVAESVNLFYGPLILMKWCSYASIFHIWVKKRVVYYFNQSEILYIIMHIWLPYWISETVYTLHCYVH